MKFRKKPVVIEAFCYCKDNLTEWFIKAKENGIVREYNGYAEIETLEGTHRANPGDYIIQGIKGELYPCKPDIFKRTYELVDEWFVGQVGVVACNCAQSIFSLEIILSQRSTKSLNGLQDVK